MLRVTLYRVDPTRNMQRYYHLSIQPDLLGNSCLMREWGRIGHSSQVRMTSYQTEEQALAAFQKQRRAKERKGYVCRL